MLVHALSYLAGCGDQSVVLWTLAGYQRTLAFYARHGFTPDGATDRFLLADGSDPPLVRLAKQLTPTRA